MTYTEKELNQFLHGINLSLLSKKSAQHWRYDEETAKEIEWLEALERKVRADKADRKTEPQTERGYMWICPNCGTENHSDFKECPCCGYTPKPNCEMCRHYLFTDIDGYYCEHETYGQPCNYEPKTEPQTDCSWK